MSGHLKLIGGRLFDWIAAGKRVYTDTSRSLGFASHRILFASDVPWGDREGELAVNGPRRAR